ncbi:hypothetical protein [Thalassotalea sp. ND16A]|uniref:hypothetical protein n=1 Tax=Thalassotalea sp. ND16A TaxID=1535422 RepID=UPI00051D4EC3|nr:hypothetical protein [Thalassotalea sp. ND16A]KGJ94209.1 hypothetical protein ND16A_1415 [Thalassotalea sp. ND16A]
MQKIAKIIITLTLLYLSYVAATYGAANLAFKQADKQLTYWQQIVGAKVGAISVTQPTKGLAANCTQGIQTCPEKTLFERINFIESYHNALVSINTAINLHQNPQYLETKAQILEWGVRAGVAPKQASLKVANKLYLQSTQLRPTWPGTWAALALNKWHLGEFDNQMIQYLINAHTYGKNRVEVHLIWAQLGGALQQSEEPKLKQLIAAHHEIVKYHQELTP